MSSNAGIANEILLGGGSWLSHSVGRGLEESCEAGLRMDQQSKDADHVKEPPGSWLAIASRAQRGGVCPQLSNPVCEGANLESGEPRILSTPFPPNASTQQPAVANRSCKSQPDLRDHYPLASATSRRPPSPRSWSGRLAGWLKSEAESATQGPGGSNDVTASFAFCFFPFAGE